MYALPGCQLTPAVNTSRFTQFPKGSAAKSSAGESVMLPLNGMELFSAAVGGAGELEPPPHPAMHKASTRTTPRFLGHSLVDPRAPCPLRGRVGGGASGLSINGPGGVL